VSEGVVEQISDVTVLQVGLEVLVLQILMNAAGPHHHASMLMDVITMLGAIPAYVTVAMSYLEVLVSILMNAPEEHTHVRVVVLCVETPKEAMNVIAFQDMSEMFPVHKLAMISMNAVCPMEVVNTSVSMR
jgi:hypothetical protein